jgi:hypothetical protein
LHADPGEQHAQVRIDFGDGAHRGTRAVVCQVLVDTDRWGEPFDSLDTRFLHISHHANRLEILAQRFMMEGVKCQGRFA